MSKLLKSIAIVTTGLFVILTSAGSLFGQDGKGGKVEQGVFWSDTAAGVSVFLMADGKMGVVSQKSVRVDYHTSINSSTAVDKELVATGTLGAVTFYQVRHSFSRTTIWMALEFTIDGKKLPELTRTFYDSYVETVPNEQFLKPRPALKP